MDPLWSGPVLVAGGTVALALATASARDLGRCLSHALLRARPGAEGGRARALWEAAARNSTLFGGLGATYGLASLLASADAARGLGGERVGELVLGPPLVGLLGAVLAALPASRHAPAAAGHEDEPATEPRSKWNHFQVAAGYALLATVLVTLFPSASTGPGMQPSHVLLHPPAWIAVAASAVAIVGYLGLERVRGSLAFAFGVAGAAGALVGLLPALHGFALSRIQTVASGFVFSLSSALCGLVGLAALGLPLEDRAVARGECRSWRLVGYGYPVAVVVLTGVLWLLASTPMRMRP